MSAGAARSTSTSLALQIVALIFALFAVVSWLRALLLRVSTELAVTDHRVIYKTGLIRRFTIEINRSKVQTVGVVTDAEPFLRALVHELGA